MNLFDDFAMAEGGIYRDATGDLFLLKRYVPADETEPPNSYGSREDGWEGCWIQISGKPDCQKDVTLRRTAVQGLGLKLYDPLRDT